MAAGRDQPPHGFVLSAEDDRLLRGPVPERALAWAARAVGEGARVVASRPLAGGTSSAVHALTVSTADGDIEELVLRRFVRSDWLAEEPDLAGHEATALEVVAGCPVPTPRLVAVDEDGGEAGEPAVLMTRLPGGVVWDPVRCRAVPADVGRDPAGGARDAGSGLCVAAQFASYRVEMRRAPRWATRPDVWETGDRAARWTSPATSGC